MLGLGPWLGAWRLREHVLDRLLRQRRAAVLWLATAGGCNGSGRTAPALLAEAAAHFRFPQLPQADALRAGTNSPSPGGVGSWVVRGTGNLGTVGTI
jgi:hypothetical protein